MVQQAAQRVEVWVAIETADIRAGVLFATRRGRTESCTFAYEPSYLATSGAYAIDPSLPLRTGSYQTPVGQAVFGAMSDCAPDRWGRTLVKRSEAAAARANGRPARQLGEIDFLLGVRDDLRQGALRFRLVEGGFLASADTGVPALTDLPELLDLAARAEQSSADLPDLQRLVRVGSSLGGARPKAHVRGDDGRVAIAKFPSASTDTWNVMAWEKVALDLARSAGIEVPHSRLLDLAGRSVLVVDRFDRHRDGRRVGYASAMTMLEARDGDQRSYLDIAAVVENVSVSAAAELAELWRRMVFSILISNTDDHLRNHGFLHVHDDVWRLAPAFDLNPNPEPGPKHLSTAVSNDDDRAAVATALDIAPLFRLRIPESNRILNDVRAAVRRWRDVARAVGLSWQECTDMAWAFEAAEAMP